MTEPIKNLIQLLLKGYKRLLSPLLPCSCRFYPSCSEYAIEALERKGLVTAIWLITRRLLRCHPFHPGGFDPLL